MKNRIIKLVLISITLTINSIGAFQNDFTQPGSTGGTVKLSTVDNVAFLVAPNWRKNLKQ